MPKIQLNVSSDQVRSRLEEKAKAFGIFWGKVPNISGLIEKIALDQIELMPDLSLVQIQALSEALYSLHQQGKYQSLQVLVELFSKLKLPPQVRLELESLLRTDYDLQLLNKLTDLISQQQPFQLSYQDAAGRVWTYTVRYAQIYFREKRNYLECWCEETQGNQDIRELQHNWSLRLDRITNAGIIPVEGEWRNRLDLVEVEFDLLGGLAHAYQEREADKEVKWLSLEPPTRRVVRRISNTFWFVREILPYGKDCVVRSPQVIRQKIREHLEAACNLYK